MDPKIKQQTLRLLTNGMYILTSRSGERFAASTVTWASQVSFRPPLIMVAIRRDSNVLRCLTESRRAALHILDKTQKAIAQKFFSATKRVGQTLNGEPFVDGKTLSPILENLPAYVECKLVDTFDEYGDHLIAILEVVEAQFYKPLKPLIVADSPWRYGG